MRKKPRILFAGIFHETHSFVEERTSLRDFTKVNGAEMLKCTGDTSPLGGALESAQAFDWEILPTVDFRALPSGLVEDDVIETWWAEFKRLAVPHFSRGVDAIYLVLHGAMVSESFSDVEGELLGRIRALPGVENTRIFGVIDLHANFTEAMAARANCLVAYRENPHTDARAAAQLAIVLLERSLATGQIPRLFRDHPPVMWPPTGTGTASEPMCSLEKLARSLEAGFPEIWSASVVAGFSFADIPETGVSFALTSSGSEADARAKLRQLSTLALELMEQGNVLETPIDTIMQKLRPLPPGLTVLVEPSDNVGGGAPGDGTGILRALLEYKIENAAVTINDPAAVKKLLNVPFGHSVSVSIGGKGSSLDAGPISLDVQLLSRSDGRFQLEDKQSHLASIFGDTMDMGPSAVVRHNGVTILLTTIKTPPFDLGQWRSQGIEPRELSVIGVKAAVAHRRAYDSIADRMYWVDTPGPCSSNLKALPFCKVQRPVYPLDKIEVLFTERSKISF